LSGAAPWDIVPRRLGRPRAHLDSRVMTALPVSPEKRRSHGPCFVCGPDNPCGMGVE
jgi:hypothetical protein